MSHPHALALDTLDLSKRFGSFTALDMVSIKVRPGTVHALLGENGAGKSTLVKCIVGYNQPDSGSVLLDGREHDIASPSVARALGIGMVYQHFTVVPGMSVAENLLLARGKLPAIIDWKKIRAELRAFLATTPFQLDLDATPQDLSAGEKQKLEILKQLYLKPRLLILDEPTSVLTPQESDEVLGLLRDRAHAGDCTVLMITHKFREVSAHADDVTVLRRGKQVASLRVAETTTAVMAEAMIGHAQAPAETDDTPPRPPVTPGEVRLAVNNLVVMGDRGEAAVRGLNLNVRAGQIVGMAGISGNGQRELMQALVGQRAVQSGTLHVSAERFYATRAQNRRLKVRALPEEPLRNACVGELSVGHNMGLRSFDESPSAHSGWIHWGVVRQRARQLISDYGVKTQGEGAAIRSLSGGNVQRAVLARELSQDADLLLVANPVFGLDFAAVAEIHGRLQLARDKGTAVLLISEDLDELLALSDRIVVISQGQVVFECDAKDADRLTLGSHMGGHSGEHSGGSHHDAHVSTELPIAA